jgi:hypothetical protein
MFSVIPVVLRGQMRGDVMRHFSLTSIRGFSRLFI